MTQAEDAVRPRALVLTSDELFPHFFPAHVTARLAEVCEWEHYAGREDTPELRERIARADALVTTWHTPFLKLETHGDFAAGRASAEVIRLADHPSLCIIWDAANSFSAGESIEDSAAAVAPYLAHVHLRDARPMGKEHWTPVLAGRGLVPFGEVVAALKRLGYEGFVSFEWEKYWHPEIEEPEVSLPDFAGAMRGALGGAVGA